MRMLGRDCISEVRADFLAVAAVGEASITAQLGRSGLCSIVRGSTRFPGFVADLILSERSSA